jgi:magnesium chelatase subunit H
MRLLFERDLTPHPQYAAFYKWLQQDFEASAVLHLGMHGTGGCRLAGTGVAAFAYGAGCLGAQWCDEQTHLCLALVWGVRI